MDAIELVKPRLWRAITVEQPFRRYYVYLSDPAEARVLQPLSVYALMFYLGSVTRYNPPLLRVMMEGRYGAFLREFLAAVLWLTSKRRIFGREKILRRHGNSASRRVCIGGLVLRPRHTASELGL